jgi:hypothetical protein
MAIMAQFGNVYYNVNMKLARILRATEKMPHGLIEFWAWPHVSVEEFMFASKMDYISSLDKFLLVIHLLLWDTRLEFSQST